MKFKVGDRVKVVKTISTYASKKEYIGRVLTITNIREGDYPYNIEPTEFWWREDELELAPFTKSELKDGMVVGMRDGTYRFVFNDALVSFYSHIMLSVFDDNMMHPSCEAYNIDKVYTTSARTLNRLFDTNNLTLIWERPKEEPAKKMTVEEIEKELGYKVEIVSNSENK